MSYLCVVRCEMEKPNTGVHLQSPGPLELFQTWKDSLGKCAQSALNVERQLEGGVLAQMWIWGDGMQKLQFETSVLWKFLDLMLVDLAKIS